MMHRVLYACVVLTVALAGCSSTPKKEVKPRRQPLTAQQKEKLLTAVAAIQKLTDEGQEAEARVDRHQRRTAPEHQSASHAPGLPTRRDDPVTSSIAEP